MVLGLRSKSRKCVSVPVQYIIHVQHIKPWPSAQFDQCVLIQWENGDQSSGSFKCVIGDEKIEVGEFFKLPVTLFKEASKKKNSSYLKNLLEFNLYEYQFDKAVKGQLLGSAVINLGEYGVTRETMNISTLVNCKKGLKNVAQQPPLLYVSIQPSDRDSCTSSPKADKGGSGSVSALDDEDEEIASFTDEDDDLSTHSSHTSSSLAQKDEQEVETSRKGRREGHLEETPFSTTSLLDPKEYKVVGAEKQKMATSTPLTGLQDEEEVSGNFNKILQQETGENGARNVKSSSRVDVYAISDDPQNQKKPLVQNKVALEEEAEISPSNGTNGSGYHENGKPEQSLKAKKNVPENELAAPGFSRWGTRKQVNFKKAGFGEQDGTVKKNELKRAKSTFASSGMEDNRELLLNIKAVSDARKNRAQRDDPKESNGSAVGNTKKTTSSPTSDVKLESKVAMLEEELREAAALEVSLYSVVAEHGSSSNKIHSPARRLYRFYSNAACNANSPTKRGSAARAIFSGLALVSKACGNDVPRLTFWLSNVIMLRAIVSHATEKAEITGRAHTGSSSSSRSKSVCYEVEKDEDWQDPQTFLVALEKVEAWVFSRIVESIWWQTMTPYMQTSSAAKSSSSRKSHGKKHMSGDREQGSISVELWTKAFKDACERLCPVRAGGHECACLPVLARLVMEQLVCRLDIAMFNAILRESADEMPTDPVSDPITDSKVLPIPAGKSGFAAGAQLKNAIGSWSRWLSDIFGIDDDSHEDPNEADDKKKTGHDASSKAFHLLNALSDLMMLPFEMLADRTTRKEFCPTFGVPAIKRVVYNFVPDEFCPGPVPNYVFEALDSEDTVDSDEESPITNIPYIAPATSYTPPSASSFMSIVGDIGNQSGRSKSSVLKKSYTSDDELDQLDTPLASIILDKNRVSPASTPPNSLSNGKGSRRVVRYQLLREVWRDGE